MGDSEIAERTWLVLHTDIGPYLLGAWYRPPQAGEVASIESLPGEQRQYSQHALATVVIGDMNVHQQSWLRHSSGGKTIEGRALQSTAADMQLKQI
eukprot:6081091-Karenia_brevis.AAC.1